MSRTISSTARAGARSVAAIAASGGIKALLQDTGRFPPVEILIKSIDPILKLLGNVSIDRFLSYKFQSSVLIPVDTFEFSFVAPDSLLAFDRRVKDGDLITLQASGSAFSTGIIDTTEVETDSEFGEKVSVVGRDLMSQLEDQDAISGDDKPIHGNKMTVKQVFEALAENTRLNKLELQDAPKKPYLFATEPGESKLAALQRYIEPLNCVAWMGPEGEMIIGRPDMAQKPRGLLFLNKSRRDSNVISMKVSRSSTSIPNVVIPIWTGQELVQDRVPEEQRLENSSDGPKRLRKAGHLVTKAVVQSIPQGHSPQELALTNPFIAGGSNLLQALAKREIARRNVNEMIVQVVVAGHYNENGEAYAVDQVYKIEYDRGNVDEKMYLYQVEYDFSEETSQKTRLHFCKLGRIVSDVRVI